MSTECRGCVPLDCGGFAADDTLYSLEQPPFLFVLNCPEGFDCGGAPFLLLNCCNETVFVGLLGMGNAQRTQVINDALTKCVNFWKFCGDNPVTPPVVPGDPPRIFLFGNRPQSCTVKCPDGNSFTFTVPAGVVYDLNQATANSIAFRFACQQARLNKICLGDLGTQFCSDSPLTLTIVATGRHNPVGDNWQVSGTIPTGMTFNGGFRTDGKVTITGTPTTPGSYTFTVTIFTNFGFSMAKTYTVCIVGVSSGAPPAGTVGVAYSSTLTAPACATPPLSWQVTAGALPPGLTLDETTGVISGTPTTGGTYNFTVTLSTEAT